MKKDHRFAIVITHTGGRRRPLIDFPWLERDYRIDASDWVVLSDAGWRDVADGDASIWDALERKLLFGFYVYRPQMIAVVGHPSGRRESDSIDSGWQEVRRIVRRVRTLLLPTAVRGFWTDESGALQDILNPLESGVNEVEFELAHSHDFPAGAAAPAVPVPDGPSRALSIKG